MKTLFIIALITALTGGAVTTNVMGAALITVTSASYMGGENHDTAQGVSEDGDCAYIIGSTVSSNFPTTGPYQSSITRWTNDDVFVTKTGSTGSTLVYSTYLGGTNRDQGFAIVADTDGTAYITGRTNSDNFPVVNAVQSSRAGGYDAFATKLSSSGSTLSFSTYHGGSADETGYAADLDPVLKRMFIAGTTESWDFPTSNCLQSTIGGERDAFVSKYVAGGSALAYATFYGGSGEDIAFGISVQTDVIACVVGSTDSTDLTLTTPYQSTIGGGFDGFVLIAHEDGTSIISSTYLGGAGTDGCRSVSVDAMNDAYIAGYTASDDFPTIGPYQSTRAGSFDGFVTKFTTATDLGYSTYLGGSGSDILRGVDVDTSYNVYVAGRSASSDFPTTDPHQSSLGGSSDAILTVLNSAGDTVSYSTYLGGTYWDEAMAIKVDSDGDAYISGKTQSADFPTTASYQDALGNSVKFWDAFYAIFE